MVAVEGLRGDKQGGERSSLGKGGERHGSGDSVGGVEGGEERGRRRVQAMVAWQWAGGETAEEAAM